MKSFCSILLLSIFGLFVACKSDSTAQSEADGNKTEGEGTHVKASKTAPIQGMWHHAVSVGNAEKVKLYEGRWIDIKPDETFTSGIWLNQNNSGT